FVRPWVVPPQGDSLEPERLRHLTADAVEQPPELLAPLRGERDPLHGRERLADIVHFGERRTRAGVETSAGPTSLQRGSQTQVCWSRQTRHMAKPHSTSTPTKASVSSPLEPYHHSTPRSTSINAAAP